MVKDAPAGLGRVVEEVAAEKPVAASAGVVARVAKRSQPAREHTPSGCGDSVAGESPTRQESG